MKSLIHSMGRNSIGSAFQNNIYLITIQFGDIKNNSMLITSDKAGLVQNQKNRIDIDKTEPAFF